MEEEVKLVDPGSEEITKLALSFINNLSPESRIADIGCGAGEKSYYGYVFCIGIKN